MAMYFAGLSAVTMIVGLFLLSSETAGVGAIGVGCTLAIFARIAQASAHNKKVLEKLDAKNSVVSS